MWTTKDGFGLRRRWGTVLLIISSACTAAVNLPSGTGSGGSSTSSAPNGGGMNANGAGGSSGGVSSGGSSGVGTPTPVGPAAAPGTMAAGPLDSGRVTMRRLNVTEWADTIRDLLGTTTVFTSAFPGDNASSVGMFDTLGEALSYSDLLFQQQNTAAAAAITELLARPVGDPIRRKIMLCEPTAATAATCYSTILTAFMKSAWRRPATAAEVTSMVTLATTTSTAATTAMQTAPTPVMEGIKAALESVLLSPYFNFHVELGSPNYSLTTNATTPLSDYEVASRLSYFLWATMPDATLTAAADMSMLAKGGATLSAQVTRMLADPKAQSLATNFAGQWLSVDGASMVSPDPTLFPKVDNALLASIAPESYAFFNALITGNQPLSALVTADYSYLNGRLATFYGVAGVPATQTTFTKVSLSGTPRTAGVLTQETFLTTTSLASRTSPVKRGAWVLTNMLCSAPQPPPNNVVPPFPAIMPGMTVRQTLDVHASIPGCSSCHQTIDPAGFPFENFDATGAYRTTDNGAAVDSSGSLVIGTTLTPVTGAAAMGTIIAADPRFAACIVKQAMTYGLGRTFDTTDGAAYITGVAQPLQKSGTWTGLLQAVATSEAFLTTRGGP